MFYTVLIWKDILENQCWGVGDNASVNSSCAQTLPHPLGLLWGIFTPCQSRGWDICKFYAAWGPGIYQRRGQPWPFDMHTVSYQNITTQRIILEKQADWLICQGWEKTEEVWKKKVHIKMLKMELLDCAINEKYCSVDGGRGICPLVSFPPQGIWQLKSPHPGNLNARGTACVGGWGWLGCCWPRLELTDG